MKRSLYMGLAALGMAAAVMATVDYAEGEAAEAACPCPYHGGTGVMKDAKVAVENTADGVKITVTSENADQVKAIQAAFANFGTGTTAPCGMVVDAAACEKAHAANACGCAVHSTCAGHVATNAPVRAHHGSRGRCW